MLKFEASPVHHRSVALMQNSDSRIAIDSVMIPFLAVYENCMLSVSQFYTLKTGIPVEEGESI